MSQNLQFIEKASASGPNISVLCREHGVLRQTGHKWLRRFRTRATPVSASRAAGRPPARSRRARRSRSASRGKPVVRGTRIAVEFVLDLIAAGRSFDEILANHPGLTVEDIRACVACAKDVLAEKRVFPA